jgi:methyl-accepting chemotaxis protein
MPRTLSVMNELIELGMRGPDLRGSDLDGIATASASTLHRSRARETGLPKPETCFAGIKQALDEQLNVMGRSASLLRAAGMSLPITSQAIERINVALHATSVIERRKLPRRCLSSPCKLVHGNVVHDMRCLDIGANGIRVFSAPVPHLAPGCPVVVHIDRLGPLNCTVRNRGRHGLNLEFCLPLSPAERAMMAGILLGLSAEQDVMMSMARELSLSLQAMFEQALSGGAITSQALFDAEYQPIFDTMPQQFTTQSLEYLEQALPPVLGGYSARGRGAVYAVATDRNGYVPVHNAPFNQPQHRDDVDFNLRFSRNKRIYHDATTLRAARFANEAIVQSYSRDLLNHPDMLVMEASAPIFVRGRRWGCAQIGFSICND